MLTMMRRTVARKNHIETVAVVGRGQRSNLLKLSENPLKYGLDNVAFTATGFELNLKRIIPVLKK